MYQVWTSKGNISYLRRNDSIVLDVITIVQKCRKKAINVKSECVFAGISFLSAAKLREVVGGEIIFFDYNDAKNFPCILYKY